MENSRKFHNILENYEMKKNFDRHPIKPKKIYFKKGKNIISENPGAFLDFYTFEQHVKTGSPLRLRGTTPRLAEYTVIGDLTL